MPKPSPTLRKEEHSNNLAPGYERGIDAGSDKHNKLPSSSVYAEMEYGSKR